MGANNISSNGVNSTERGILRELGVDSGSHFKVILKAIRQFLKLGYSFADAVYATSYSAGYISRQITLTPKEKRNERRDYLIGIQRTEAEKLRVLYNRYYLAYTKKLNDIRKEEERRQLHASRLRTFKKGNTPLIRYTAFGIIKVRNADADDWSDLAQHISYVTNRRRLELQAKKYREQQSIRDALVAGGRHLTARVAVPEKDLPNNEAPLPVLVARFIPGARAPAFRQYAFMHRYMQPLAMIEGFLGHKVGQQEETEQEQPITPPAAIVAEVAEELTPAQEIVPAAVQLPPKREGSTSTVTTRPDQADFADAVRHNCFDRCVITGARTRYRTEAAHLVEHRRGGIDHYSNGLLLRIDIHRLFDENVLAIHPVTLTVHVDPAILIFDQDLQQYHSQPIATLRQPINTAFLITRWEKFQCLTQPA
ncbi:HNH endonuclease [Enterobacter hormaechei]|nr:HNH endonuclease [Enterobacter hormaechei]